MTLTHLCPLCGMPFPSDAICTGIYVDPNGIHVPHESVAVVPVGSVVLTSCGYCRVSPGELHDDRCDFAHCPECGGQREMCFLFQSGCNSGVSYWMGEGPLDRAVREVAPGLVTWLHLPSSSARRVPDDFRVRSELAWHRTEQRWVEHRAGDEVSLSPQCWWVVRLP